jgi:hypothetical protein
MWQGLVGCSLYMTNDLPYEKGNNSTPPCIAKLELRFHEPIASFVLIVTQISWDYFVRPVLI